MCMIFILTERVFFWYRIVVYVLDISWAQAVFPSNILKGDNHDKKFTYIHLHAFPHILTSKHLREKDSMHSYYTL